MSLLQAYSLTVAYISAENGVAEVALSATGPFYTNTTNNPIKAVFLQQANNSSAFQLVGEDPDDGVDNQSAAPGLGHGLGDPGQDPFTNELKAPPGDQLPPYVSIPLPLHDNYRPAPGHPPFGPGPVHLLPPTHPSPPTRPNLTGQIFTIPLGNPNDVIKPMVLNIHITIASTFVIDGKPTVVAKDIAFRPLFPGDPPDTFGVVGGLALI